MVLLWRTHIAVAGEGAWQAQGGRTAGRRPRASPSAGRMRPFRPRTTGEEWRALYTRGGRTTCRQALLWAGATYGRAGGRGSERPCGARRFGGAGALSAGSEHRRPAGARRPLLHRAPAQRSRHQGARQRPLPCRVHRRCDAKVHSCCLDGEGRGRGGVPCRSDGGGRGSGQWQVRVYTALQTSHSRHVIAVRLSRVRHVSICDRDTTAYDHHVRHVAVM